MFTPLVSLIHPQQCNTHSLNLFNPLNHPIYPATQIVVAFPNNSPILAAFSFDFEVGEKESRPSMSQYVA